MNEVYLFLHYFLELLVIVVDGVSISYLFLVRLGDDPEPVHGDGDDGHGGHEGCHTGNGTHESTNYYMINNFLKH